MTNNQLSLTQEWDKTFALSDKVHYEKVTFKTQYGFTLAADLYVPKSSPFKGEREGLPALAVCGPFGAVKEQAEYSK